MAENLFNMLGTLGKNIGKGYNNIFLNPSNFEIVSFILMAVGTLIYLLIAIFLH